MFQVGREHELQDVVDGDLGLDVLEFWRLLRDGQQEDVTLLVSGLCVVRAPESVPNGILSVLASESRHSLNFLHSGVSVRHLPTRESFLSGSDGRVFVSKELLPSDDRRLELDLLLSLVVPDHIHLVDEQEDDGLGS